MRRRLRDVVLTPEHLESVVRDYLRFEEFAFDVETTSLRVRDNEVGWLSLAGPGRADVIPMGHPLGELIEPARKEKEPWWDEDNPTKTGKPRKKWRTVHIPAVYDDPPEQMWPSQVFEILRPLFFSPTIRKGGHNTKFDLQTIVKYYDGEFPPPPYFDTLVDVHLIDERAPAKDLAAQIRNHFGFTYPQIGKKWWEHSFSEAYRYSRLDSKYTWLLRQWTKTLLVGSLRGAWKLDMDVFQVLMAMEYEGVLVDEKARKELGDKLEKELTELRGKLYKAAGQEWNLNSTPQKQWFVYDVCGKKVHDYTDGGKKKKNPLPATDKAALERYKSDPRISNLLLYSARSTLYSTFVRGIPDLRQSDGRVHTSYNLDGTRTGRLSSSGPNNQNIPAPREEEEVSTMTRAMYVSRLGFLLIVADFSQIELRLMAHFSGDLKMISAFKRDVDFHKATAAMIYRISEDQVTSTQRAHAKNMNFLKGYGGGPGLLAKQSGIKLSAAEEIFEKDRREFRRLYEWKKEEIRKARRRKPVPYVETLFGHRRRLPELRSPVDDIRASAERQVINTLIQGSAGDLIKFALVRLYHSLPPEANILLTVHDEIVAEAPESMAEEVKEIVEEAMAGPEVNDLFRVPITAEAKIVSNWSEAKD